MYSKFQLGLRYLNYYFRSSNGKGHGIHSPFVFDFVTKILNNKDDNPVYHQPELLRQQLMNDETRLEIEDLGAGSVVSGSSKRTVSSIAKNAAKPKKYGQLLYRMARYYQPGTIVELGTSLGITTSYLALAKPDAKVITMEGAHSVASIAKNNFCELKLENISLIEGNFDDRLSQVLNELPIVDFCFIDGNHRREPTEAYFFQLLPKIHNDAILIFDDIHWSRGMEEAWENIKQHEAVRCTIDLFFIGIVFFRQEMKEKQHFMIRF